MKGWEEGGYSWAWNLFYLIGWLFASSSAIISDAQ